MGHRGKVRVARLTAEKGGVDGVQGNEGRGRRNYQPVSACSYRRASVRTGCFDCADDTLPKTRGDEASECGLGKKRATERWDVAGPNPWPLEKSGDVL